MLHQTAQFYYKFLILRRVLDPAFFLFPDIPVRIFGQPSIPDPTYARVSGRFEEVGVNVQCGIRLCERLQL
jgi:hypothetical protein